MRVKDDLSYSGSKEDKVIDTNDKFNVQADDKLSGPGVAIEPNDKPRSYMVYISEKNQILSQPRHHIRHL